MLEDLNPSKALTFRIVHRDNVPWILDNGLHCKNSAVIDPKYVVIGNTDLIDRRSVRVVPQPPGGVLSDYIPFYFTPFSPMFLNIKTGRNGIRQRKNEEIVILVSSLRKLSTSNIPFLFTDRHASLRTAQFFSNLEYLDQIDWDPLQRRDFKRDPEHPEKFERYEAEALVHRHLPTSGLLGMICYNDSVASDLTQHVTARSLEMKVVAKNNWYF